MTGQKEKRAGLNPARARDHLATLDGLRGVAAFAVVLEHARGLANIKIGLPYSTFPHGHLAVDFFFMLSGFVIAKAYEAKLKSSMTFSRFVVIRLVRLYPLIIAGALLGACVLTIRLVTTHSLTVDQLLIATLSALAILPTTALGSLRSELFPVNPPQWSLFFELVVNFVYAPLARWLTLQRLMVICALSGVALCYVAVSNEGLNVGPAAGTFFLGFIRVTFPFSIGVLLFRVRPACRMTGLVSIILMLLLAAVLFAPYFEGEWFYEFIAVALVFPPIIFLGAGCKNGAILNVLCLSAGELSYPLYVTHHPVLRIITNAFNMMHWHVATSVVVVLCTIAAILVAALFLKIWDQPVRACLGAAVRGADTARR